MLDEGERSRVSVRGVDDVGIARPRRGDALRRDVELVAQPNRLEEENLLGASAQIGHGATQVLSPSA